ncbi:MAG: PilZ domain-containing protein [Desulfovibrio sp.]
MENISYMLLGAGTTCVALIVLFLLIKKKKRTHCDAGSLSLNISDFNSTYAKEGFDNLRNHLTASSSDIYQLEHTSEDGSPIPARLQNSAEEQLPQRGFKRKRVRDQKFIKVHLWMQGYKESDTIYRPPADILINDYSSQSPQQLQNEIINISNGGLGLKLSTQHAQQLLPGDTTVLHLSLYNVKHKDYLPYWFGARVQNSVELDDDFSRVGLKFVVHGSIDPTDGKVLWSPILEK